MRKSGAAVMSLLLVLGLLVGWAAPVTTGAVSEGARSHVNGALLALEHNLQRWVPPARLAPVGYLSTNGPVTEVDTFNWSGYADATTDQPVTTCGQGDGCGSISYATGSWTIPAVSCPAPPFRNEDQFSVNWVGIDGFNDQTVEQTGSASYCFEGNAYYYNWYELYPAATVVLGPASCIDDNVGCPQPGDRITASVAVQPGSGGNDNYDITLTDDNSPANSGSTTQPCATYVCFDNSAEWVVERPAYEPVPGAIFFIPLSFFAQTAFADANVVSNGRLSSIEGYEPNVYDMNMIDASETYYLACPNQREPVGSLLLIPTSSTTPDPCAAVPPNGGQWSSATRSNGPGGTGNQGGYGTGRQSGFNVTWDDSF
jgi:Peptidase A4 family